MDNARIRQEDELLNIDCMLKGNCLGIFNQLTMQNQLLVKKYVEQGRLVLCKKIKDDEIYILSVMAFYKLNIKHDLQIV